MKPHKTISFWVPELNPAQKKMLLIELLGLAPSKRFKISGEIKDRRANGFNEAINEYEQRIIEFMEG